MEERVKKFKNIFYGLDRAYGQYKSDGQLVNGKASGQAFIKKAPVTDQLWIDHLNKKEPYCVDPKAIKIHSRNILLDISNKVDMVLKNDNLTDSGV